MIHLTLKSEKPDLGSHGVNRILMPGEIPPIGFIRKAMWGSCLAGRSSQWLLISSTLLKPSPGFLSWMMFLLPPFLFFFRKRVVNRFAAGGGWSSCACSYHTLFLTIHYIYIYRTNLYPLTLELGKFRINRVDPSWAMHFSEEWRHIGNRNEFQKWWEVFVNHTSRGNN